MISYYRFRPHHYFFGAIAVLFGLPLGARRVKRTKGGPTLLVNASGAQQASP